MTPLEAALKYMEMGLSVIPVRPDKKPHLKWTEFQERRASREEIESWFKRWPSAMVGIVTGQLSGIVVVDCDSEEAYRKIQELIPDAFITCISRTPRGYHLYLVMPAEKIGNAAGVLPGVDIRGEGGYVIAPPSVNGAGKGYSWLDSLSFFDVAPAPAPIDLFNSFSLHIGDVRKEKSNSLQFLTQGTRDNDLFHIGNCLIKGGCEETKASQVLEILAKNCKPPFPVKDAQAKINSVLTRCEKKERNLTQDLRQWIDLTSAYFSLTEAYSPLQVLTSQKNTVHQIMHRFVKEGYVERHPNKNGIYRRIDREVEFMDFASADIENTVDLRLPLDMHVKTKIYPKGVVVAAGVSGMGKTLYALNAIAMNRGKFPIYYFNSEMGPEALKKKLSHFPIPIDEWARSMKVVDNWDFYNIADKIQPDAFNVIDYLEPEGEKPFNIHGVISAIIRRLDKGTALIAVQKKPGATLGTGGIYSIKAATLALAIDWGKIEIVKNRFREGDPNPDRGKVNFEVTNGHQIVQKGPWYR